MLPYDPRLNHVGCDHFDTAEKQVEVAACELESALAELESIGFTPANLDEVHDQLRQLRHAWNYLNTPQPPE